MSLRAIERNYVRNITLGLHEQPECSGEEEFAYRTLTSSLAGAGFLIHGVAGLPTAFSAALSGNATGPHIAILAEYDALPEIGHGCGHHLVAGAALAAGLELASRANTLKCAVSILGCPAEETLTGKRAMLAAGAFDDVDAAITFHPSPYTSIMTRSTGLRLFSFEYHGIAAHASSDPHRGASALEGVLGLFSSINSLRQFVRDDVRIHGVIRNGGSAWNVVPELASCEIGIRSWDSDELERVASRVIACAEASASATNTSCTVTERSSAEPVRIDNELVACAQRVLTTRGHSVGEWEALASTDFGDVSQRLPAVLFSIATWPKDIPFHTRQATEYGRLETALDAMFEAGEAMVDLVNCIAELISSRHTEGRSI